MKQYLLTSLLFALLLMTACDEESPNDPNPPSGNNYLAVVMDGGLDILDLDEGDWVGTTLGLGTAPNDIVLNAPTIYVINSTSCDLQQFDLERDGWRYTRRLDLGLAQNRNPYNGALHNDDRMLVTNLLDNSVSVVDLIDWDVDTLWDAGAAPEGVLVAGDRGYVVNSGYDFPTLSFHHGSIYVYDIPSGERVDSLTVGINAQYIELLDTGQLAVSCTGDYGSNPGEIWIVERDPLAVSERIPVEGSPGRVRVSEDGWLYCASGGWSMDGETEGLVLRWPSAVNASSMELVGTALGTIDIAPTYSGRVYVAAREGQNLQHFEGDSLVRSYALPDSPVALAYFHL